MNRALTILAVIGFAWPQPTFAQPQPPPRPPGEAFNGSEPGEVPENQVSIRINGQFRFLTANGIPDHAVGRFPNRNNPNTIRAQNYSFRLPMRPVTNAEPTRVGLMPFGVGLNGVPFDPGAAEFWNRDWNSGWQYEALGGAVNLGTDQNNAHVQPTGAYHYHGMPVGLANRVDSGKGMVLVGYAADGFPIYARYGYERTDDAASGVKAMRSSWRLKAGDRPGGPGGRYDGSFVEDYEYVAGAGDLDECNGRFGPTPEHPDGIYHYYITDGFPFIPRYFRGRPDESFQRRGPPGGGPGRRPPGGGFGPPPRGFDSPDSNRPPGR